MRLNAWEQTILAGFLTSRDELLARDWQGDHLPYGLVLGRWRIEIDNARRGYVATMPAKWLGRAVADNPRSLGDSPRTTAVAQGSWRTDDSQAQ